MNRTLCVQGCQIGQKAPIGLLLAAVGTLKFVFGALLLFGLLFKQLVATLDKLIHLCA